MCIWPSVFQSLGSYQTTPPHHQIKITRVCCWELRTGSQCVQLETIRFTLRQLIKYHLTRGERRAESQQRLINTLNFVEADPNTHPRCLKTATSSAEQTPEHDLDCRQPLISIMNFNNNTQGGRAEPSGPVKTSNTQIYFNETDDNQILFLTEMAMVIY